jgi:Heparinase II/III-like protein/Heparinase II/III N-terminus
VSSARWYLARLRAMTPAEPAHRLRERARRVVRRWAAAEGSTRLRPNPPDTGRPPSLSFFDVTLPLGGGRIDWSRDYRNGRVAPALFYGQLDYRDFAQVGDSKYTWELNRHQFLVPWALAYRESADESQAAWIVYVILDWIAANPRYLGINWCSSLELALRILSWGIALDLSQSSPHVRAARAEVAQSVGEQARYVKGTLSEHSSANNHLIGELVGLLASAVFFPELPEAGRYAEYARVRILEESRRQTLPDGVNREQAIYYHHYVTEYLMTADALLTRRGSAYPELRERARRMLEFVDAMTDDEGQAFDVGDRDEGTVTGLNGGTSVGIYESLLWSGWALFGDAHLGAHAARIARSRGAPEVPDPRTVYWHGGGGGTPPEIRSPQRRLFPEGGYFVASDEGLTVLFKAGPFGYPSIAAHAHCDQLSFQLKQGGKTILGDSGTGVYHTEEGWRRFFKGTRAHNTVTVDGRDQAEYAGPFLWGSHANGRLIVERDEPDRFDLRGSHGGYGRLADPVEHERCLTYRRGLGYRVRDRLHARRLHGYTLVWNFGPRVQIRRSEPTSDASTMWEVMLGDERLLTLMIRASAPIVVRVRCGDESGPAGFASSRYLEWHAVPSLWAELSAACCELETFLLTRASTSPEENEEALEGWS